MVALQGKLQSFRCHAGPVFLGNGFCPSTSLMTMTEMSTEAEFSECPQLYPTMHGDLRNGCGQAALRQRIQPCRGHIPLRGKRYHERKWRTGKRCGNRSECVAPGGVDQDGAGREGRAGRDMQRRWEKSEARMTKCDAIVGRRTRNRSIHGKFCHSCRCCNQVTDREQYQNLSPDYFLVDQSIRFLDISMVLYQFLL